MRRILVAIGFFLTFSMPSLAQTTKENTSISNAIESFLSNYCIEKKHSSESIHINKLQIDNSKKTINISISNSFAQNIYAETQKLCISGEKEDNHLLRCEVFEDDSVDVAANSLAKFLLHNVWTILNWGEDEWVTFANNFKELTDSSKFYEALGEPLTEVVLINRLYSKLSGFID